MLNGEGNENSEKKKQTSKTKHQYNMKLPELHILWRN